jgi:hypothetical protein
LLLLLLPPLLPPMQCISMHSAQQRVNRRFVPLPPRLISELN